MPSPKQDVTVELFYDGGWYDITQDDDVLSEQPIVITRGQGEESPALRPATVSLRLANDDDRYRVSNPESPLYGKAGRNTPLRISVGSSIRAIVKGSSWRAGQSRDFRQHPRRGKSWVDLQGGGLAQQINQWKQKLRSALYRSVGLSGTTPAEWWPMEDAAGSSAAVSAVDGQSMTPVTVVRYTLPDGSPLAPGGAPQFAQGAGVSGSDLLPSFQQGGTLRGPIRTTTFNGYAIDWVMQFQGGTDNGGTTSADVLSWREAGTYVHFTVNVTKNFVTVFHSNAADDATLSFTGSATAALDPYDGAAHHYRYQVRQNGANYQAELYIDGVLYATADNFTPGMAGTVGAPTLVEWNPAEDRGDYMPSAAGHLIVWASGQNGDQPAVFNALNGHAGELASYRVGRLLEEHNIDYFVSASFDNSSPMGAQRVDTLANLLNEIVSTEDALLFDYANSARLFFLSRADRYNQVPALELYPEDLPFLPEEVTDDLDVRNVVTAAQREGGDYTAVDDTSPLGTQEPPDGVGEYQQRVDVNIADEDDLPQYANWWLRRGTVNLPRYPRVMINLAALSPSRIAQIEAVDIGDVITITGYREYTIRLHVLGYQEVIGSHSRTITFNCAPDQQFAGGEYDDGIVRYDSSSTTVKTAVTLTGTSITFRTTNILDLWSTTGTPYDVVIAGQRSRVTNMGAASLVSGAYEQTATVVRGIDGIRKTIAAEEPIHVATPGRYSL